MNKGRSRYLGTGSVKSTCAPRTVCFCYSIQTLGHITSIPTIAEMNQIHASLGYIYVCLSIDDTRKPPPLQNIYIKPGHNDDMIRSIDINSLHEYIRCAAFSTSSTYSSSMIEYLTSSSLDETHVPLPPSCRSSRPALQHPMRVPTLYIVHTYITHASSSNTPPPLLHSTYYIMLP